MRKRQAGPCPVPALLLFFTLTCVFWIAGCTENGGEGEEGDSIAAVVSLLEEMPHWALLSPDQRHTKKWREIELTVRTIAEYDLDVIRAAMATFSVESRYGEGKLYVINKYLFDLPETVRRDSPHFPYIAGEWSGLPITGDSFNPRPSDEVSARWPWRQEEDGTWRLTGTFAGYFGAPYDALAAFDYYRENFGRREAKK